VKGTNKLSTQERRLLSGIANADDDPLELAAKARIDPNEFLTFLEEMNLHRDERAKQLWVASNLMADSDLRPLLKETEARYGFTLTKSHRELRLLNTVLAVLLVLIGIAVGVGVVGSVAPLVTTGLVALAGAAAALASVARGTRSEEFERSRLEKTSFDRALLESLSQKVELGQKFPNGQFFAAQLSQTIQYLTKGAVR